MRLVCGTDGCDVGLRSDNRSGRSMLCAQREWRRKRQNERLRSDPEWAERMRKLKREYMRRATSTPEGRELKRARDRAAYHRKRAEAGLPQRARSVLSPDAYCDYLAFRRAKFPAAEALAKVLDT